MIQIYQYEQEIDNRNRVAISKMTHDDALSAVRGFLMTFNRLKFQIFADVSYEARGGYHLHTSPVIALRKRAFVMGDNPLSKFDKNLCWARPKNTRIQIDWTHPMFDKKYKEPEKYRDLILTYPAMDVILKIYAVPCENSNSHVKGVLQTGLE